MKIAVLLVAGTVVLSVTGLIVGKFYQAWDNDPDRGAVAIEDGAFGESYSTPVYLDQGWEAADSLWFYNTTQGSGLLPYDLFLVLEQTDSETLFRAPKNMDRFRYLAQKATFFNPDALAVGFVKDSYQGMDYVGYTCAACHTGQINYRGQAIRIDGGPAMADMVGFLTALKKALKNAQQGPKGERFVAAVLALGNNYDSADKVRADLVDWTDRIDLYNTVNHSRVKYGYARLDAFGRIYNRVLQHVINKRQLASLLRGVRVFRTVTTDTGSKSKKVRLLSDAQIDKVLAELPDDNIIIRDTEFAQIVSNLFSTRAGYPGLGLKHFLYVRNAIFNPPDAPVSYPFLWDTAHSDYVQWNGLASNASVGPLGRNAGEVIGVFGILDWQVDDRWFGLRSWLGKLSLSGWASGQENKAQQIYFKSSIDLTNLQRLESHLKKLTSPQWPQQILGPIDREKAARGQLVYAQMCQSCHEIIDRTNSQRVVIAKMLGLKKAGTDVAMAQNSANYTGASGNFVHTYQATGVGEVIVEEIAPVATILTAAIRGVVTTPDPDKWLLRRWLDWAYILLISIFDNDIQPSLKSGNYKPDTTANPYASLLAYKARSLNGIWATAPYLHNGSVPSLYDLLLPPKRDRDPVEGEYRMAPFTVGSREFDPVKVGFRTGGYDGFVFRTVQRGNKNSGHLYGTRKLSGQSRWDLIEYLKTL